ncbi:MAG: hypothetical protein R2705_20880 [Ilumatobacteraceae bacterium]
MASELSRARNPARGSRSFQSVLQRVLDLEAAETPADTLLGLPIPDGVLAVPPLVRFERKELAVAPTGVWVTTTLDTVDEPAVRPRRWPRRGERLMSGEIDHRELVESLERVARFIEPLLGGIPIRLGIGVRPALGSEIAPPLLLGDIVIARPRALLRRISADGPLSGVQLDPLHRLLASG